MNAKQRRAASRRVGSLVGKTVTLLPTCWVRRRYGLTDGVVAPSPSSALRGVALVEVEDAPEHLSVVKIALKSLRVHREVQEG